MPSDHRILTYIDCSVCGHREHGDGMEDRLIEHFARKHCVVAKDVGPKRETVVMVSPPSPKPPAIDKMRPEQLVNRRGDVLEVDLWYPGLPENDKAIQVGLMSVRAAADIRVTYDMERDGWVVSMLRIEPLDGVGGGGAMIEPETWVEQAFIEAWAGEDHNKDRGTT